MNKIPTFLNFTNQKASDREFILYTKYPTFLSEVHTFDSEIEVSEFEKKFAQTCNENKIQPFGCRSKKCWRGKYYFFSIIIFYQSLDQTQVAYDRLSRIIQRMSDWYLYNVIN